jgi:hypothetical protein
MRGRTAGSAGEPQEDVAGPQSHENSGSSSPKVASKDETPPEPQPGAFSSWGETMFPPHEPPFLM